MKNEKQKTIPGTERASAAHLAPVADGQHRTTSVRRDPVQVYIDVTPAIAAEYLAKNRRNRTVKQSRVDHYAALMLSGEWDYADSDICVGEDGDLYNGQHRLMAVVRSGMTVRMAFKLGMPSRSRQYMDGNEPRNAVDVCYIETGDRHGRTTAAVYTAIHFLKTKGNIANNDRVDWRILDAQHREHGPDLAAVIGAMKDNNRRFMNAAVICVLVIAYRVEPEKTLEFCRKLVTGADLPAKSPILALRNFILEEFPKGRADASGRDALCSRTFSAVDAYVRGRDRNFVKINEAARAKYLAPWRGTGEG